MKITVVVPVYNSEKSIGNLVIEIISVLKSHDFEIILVNDGSRDASEEICEQIASENERIKFISLRKNFGEHNAVLCGLNYSAGDYSIIIDDDFQNPPSEILKLINEIEKGYDVVYSQYHKKRHNLYRNAISAINNAVATAIIGKPKHLYLSSYKIISRDIVDEMVKYKGPFPYIDGLIIRTTNNIGSVFVNHGKRVFGKSNYNFRKLFSLYLNMFVNFSLRPLRIFTIIGIFIFLIGIALSIYVIISKYTSVELPGWTSTALFILLPSGFQIIFLGLIGEYLGKQYLDQNNTPQWVIKKKKIKKD